MCRDPRVASPLKTIRGGPPRSFRRRGARRIVAAAWLLAVASTALAEGPPSQPWFPEAPPLGEPAGEVIRVADVEGLFRAARTVRPGGTIVVADGHYRMPRYFELRTDRVTLRGESGRRDRVILDGAQSRHGELVGITGCSDVIVADLTIRNARHNGFKINSDKFTTRVTIRNCVIHNVWQRGVKGPAVRKEDRDTFRPSDCRIEYCLFYNDRPKRFSDDPSDTAENFGGNYVGGIDAMYPRRWIVADNVFVGIRGRTGEARGAVFLWHDAEDCVVERNVVIDCDAGICLGNSYRGPDTEIHCRRCIVRNNFVTRCPENGILADYTEDCRIVHNSVHDPESRQKRLVRLVHDNGGLVVANNLLSGPPMRRETSSPIREFGNVTGDRSHALVDVASGNLRLASREPEVVDACDPVAEVADDIDRRPRDRRPDAGAHEWIEKP